MLLDRIESLDFTPDYDVARSLAEARWGRGGTNAMSTNRTGTYYFSCSGHGGYVVPADRLTNDERERVESLGETPVDIPILVQDQDDGEVVLGWSNPFTTQENSISYDPGKGDIEWVDYPVYFFEEDVGWAVLEKMTDIRCPGHVENWTENHDRPYDTVVEETLVNWNDYEPTVTVQFTPQQAVPTADGRLVESPDHDPVTFNVPLSDALDRHGELVEPDTYESDQLRDAPAAPDWVTDWDGPFYCSVVDAPHESVVEQFARNRTADAFDVVVQLAEQNRLEDDDKTFEEQTDACEAVQSVKRDVLEAMKQRDVSSLTVGADADRALETVLSLAEQNILDDSNVIDETLEAERIRQKNAVRHVQAITRVIRPSDKQSTTTGMGR